MESTALKQVMREIIQETFGGKTGNELYDFGGIRDEDELAKIFDIDSIIAIELIVRLENRLNFEFDEDNLSTDTVSSINSLAECYYNAIEKQSMY